MRSLTLPNTNQLLSEYASITGHACAIHEDAAACRSLDHTQSMSASTTPAERYAGMVADACFHMPAHVRNNRDALRQDFARRLAEVDSDNDLPADEMQSQAVAAATFAAGLFALGDVHLAPRVLEMPDVQERIVTLKSVLDAMLPDEFEDRSPEALVAAALTHANNIEFDEVAGVYRLIG